MEDQLLKIEQLKTLSTNQLHIDLEVDGGVNRNRKKCVDGGKHFSCWIFFI